MSPLFTFCYQNVLCTIYSSYQTAKIKHISEQLPHYPCMGEPGTYKLCRTKLAKKIYFLEVMALIKFFYQETEKITHIIILTITVLKKEASSRIKSARQIHTGPANPKNLSFLPFFLFW